MSEVSLHRHAEEELNEAALFYELRTPGLGEAFVQQVWSSLKRLAKHPRAGPIWFEEYRHYQIPQFPYKVIYRLEGLNLFVLAVAHTSRKPGYWRKRR